jgi:hypothetical protein
MRPALADAAPTGSQAIPVPTTEERRARDAALLEKLEILLELELLEDWDPEQDMPIPATSAEDASVEDPE